MERPTLPYARRPRRRPAQLTAVAAVVTVALHVAVLAVSVRIWLWLDRLLIGGGAASLAAGRTRDVLLALALMTILLACAVATALSLVRYIRLLLRPEDLPADGDDDNDDGAANSTVDPPAGTA